jgi:hypothetical protein
VCVCPRVRVACVQCVFEGMPERSSRDTKAMSRPCCMVTSHGKAVAGSWRGPNGGGGVTAVVRPWLGPRGVCAWVRARRPRLPGPWLIAGEAARRWSRGQGTAG